MECLEPLNVLWKMVGRSVGGYMGWYLYIGWVGWGSSPLVGGVHPSHWALFKCSMSGKCTCTAADCVMKRVPPSDRSFTTEKQRGLHEGGRDKLSQFLFIRFPTKKGKSHVGSRLARAQHHEGIVQQTSEDEQQCVETRKGYSSWRRASSLAEVE